jgi:uncharacterized membrane protein YphA (DoxX/SURF4 family)
MSKHTRIILQLGLAFAFLYPPVAAYFDPFAWIGYFPDFLREMAGNDFLLLHAFGAIEVVVALWLLTGWRIFWPSLLAALMLLGIIVFDFSQMDVIFRDVSILAIAVALMWDGYPGRESAA